MPTHKSRVASLLGRFRRNENGSAAVEFGILALPFAVVIFAILESCVSFASQQVLANATDDIARKIRTGQDQSASGGVNWKNPTKANVEDAICARLDIMVGSSCKSRLTVDLRSFTTFADGAAIKIKVVNEVLDTTGFKVQAGGSGSRNMLRVFYRWPVMTDIMRLSMSNIKDPANPTSRSIIQIATATWQNEAY